MRGYCTSCRRYCTRAEEEGRRAGQGRGEEGRAGQGRAGQGRGEQGRAGQGRVGQGRVGSHEVAAGSTCNLLFTIFFLGETSEARWSSEVWPKLRRTDEPLTFLRGKIKNMVPVDFGKYPPRY